VKAQVIESDRLLLKPLGEEHISSAYVAWLNDPDVIRYLESGGDYSMDQLETYVRNVLAQDIYFWAIHLKESGKHIGNIKIDPVNLKHRFGEYGILLGEKNEWGKGYGKEASIRIIDYCFQEINLRKINLGVVLDNMAAFNLYKSIGFELEGIYRSHGFYNGKYCDIARMAIFNPELKI